MTVEIIESATSVRAVTWVKVTEAPPIKANGIDRMISPYAVEITWDYRQVSTPDGWVEHRWLARGATVHGQQILKPAKDGTMRLGVNVHQAAWSGFGDKDLTEVVRDDDRQVPEWVAAIIEGQRPSGELVLTVTL